MSESTTAADDGLGGSFEGKRHGHGDGHSSLSPAKKKSRTDQPPPYGSKDYWESRYRRQFKKLQERVVDWEEKETEVEDDEHDDTARLVETLPYHPWYFPYDELRVIILPIILGGRQDSYHIANHSDEDDVDGASANEDDKVTKAEAPTSADDDDNGINASPACERVDDPGNSQDNSHESDDEDEGGSITDEDEIAQDDYYEEVVSDDNSEEDEEEVNRIGLAVNGPISILEVGCGDVPLSCGLLTELKSLQDQTEAKITSVVAKVVATDYSSVVVAAMREQYCVDQTSDGTNHSTSSGNKLLSFETVDARKMPYPDSSFELILEKGVLDAMLSDKEHGCSNCVEIVTECGRVVATGGVIVLVSHLNANTAKGLMWLEEVVFAGLTKVKENAAWEIEVHGKGEERLITDPDEEQDEEEESPGPAVYVIHKRIPDADQDDSGTIPLKFFIY